MAWHPRIETGAGVRWLREQVRKKTAANRESKCSRQIHQDTLDPRSMLRARAAFLSPNLKERDKFIMGNGDWGSVPAGGTGPWDKLFVVQGLHAALLRCAAL
jgi:hypothetical protein